MNNAGGIVVGIALNDANGSLHYPSAIIGMTAGFTKLVSYICSLPDFHLTQMVN